MTLVIFDDVIDWTVNIWLTLLGLRGGMVNANEGQGRSAAKTRGRGDGMDLHVLY